MSKGSIRKKKNPTPEKGIRKMRKKKKKKNSVFSQAVYPMVIGINLLCIESHC
jgi:hypothetical protein